MITIFSIISLLILVIYTGIMVVREEGIPYSLSATFYCLEHPRWFSAIIISSAFLVLPAALDVSTDQSRFLIFMSVVGMFLVGAAPNFRDEDRVLHTAGACVLLICSQLWVLFNSPVFLYSWLVWISGTASYALVKLSEYDSAVTAFYHSRPMFWIEITALFCVYSIVFFK